MFHKRIRPPAIAAIAFAAALAVAGPAARAASNVDSMLATGSYVLGDGTSGFISGSDARSYPGNNPVDVLMFPGFGINEAGLHSYGSTEGNFGSRSSGYGVYDVSGSFRIVETITNASAFAQTATFNFFITPGLLSNTIGSALTGNDFVTAGLKFDIKLNGNSIWDSSASLTTNAGGTGSLVTSGTNLYHGNTTDPTYYTVGGVSQSIDLGVINAFQSVTLSYQLDTFARGSSSAGDPRVVGPTTYHVPDQWVTPGCSGYGYGGYGYGGCIVGAGDGVLIPAHDVVVPGYTVPGSASGSHASSGDPFDIDTKGILSTRRTDGSNPMVSSVILAAVPEPSTYALLLAGMGLVGWAARRQRSKTSSALVER